MLNRTLIAATLALLTLPAVAAHAGAYAASAPPLGECSGAVDFACLHWDCNLIACVRLFCPVFIGGQHSAGSFGCTPH